jgi:hypothetical protein
MPAKRAGAHSCLTLLNTERDQFAHWRLRALAAGRPLVRRRPGPVDLGVGAIRYGAGIGDRVERAMAGQVAEFEVLGPWSLKTSRRFWEGFTPAALAGEPGGPGSRT